MSLSLLETRCGFNPKHGRLRSSKNKRKSQPYIQIKDADPMVAIQSMNQRLGFKQLRSHHSRCHITRRKGEEEATRGSSFPNARNNLQGKMLGFTKYTARIDIMIEDVFEFLQKLKDHPR